MSTVSVMRLLRLEYGISIRELANSADVSHQYISGIELGKYPCGVNNTLIQRAFDKLIQQRIEQARRLSDAYARNRHRLLEFVEDDYEL